jgi:hypothetical protein
MSIIKVSGILRSLIISLIKDYINEEMRMKLKKRPMFKTCFVRRTKRVNHSRKIYVGKRNRNPYKHHENK